MMTMLNLSIYTMCTAADLSAINVRTKMMMTEIYIQGQRSIRVINGVLNQFGQRMQWSRI